MATERGKLARLRSYDWDAIAGIVAACVALVLHLVGLANQEVVSAIVLVVLALLLLRDVRREERDERVEASTLATQRLIERIEMSMTPPDAVLVGPRQLRRSSELFAQNARGEMTWFNVCLLMFKPQPLFDALLRPAVENPAVTAIQFVLDESERERWDNDVMPKVAQCAGTAKVREPRWSKLDESVSFILADNDAGGTEAHLSFWGEPFMARTTGRDLPRYIFHVQPHSELIPRLVELERSYRSPL
jgi:hypothetical protein